VHERIVVGYDGSRHSLTATGVGAQLARSWQCPMELVHVSPAREQAATPPAGWPVRFVEGSDPAAELARLVPAPEHGLLCLATRGQNALGEALYGSVTSAMLRGLQAPLVMVGPRVTTPRRERLERILVCLDGSVLSEAILPTVRSWAEALEIEVRLLYVAPPPDIDNDWQPFPDDQEHAVIDRVEQASNELRAAGVDADWMIAEHADAAGAIVRQAAYRTVDLIAMTTHGRTGLRRMLVGSVSADVVRTATTPVLLARPADLG